ncbi:4,5-DOPA dioxygenase extradiol [Desulfosediminicola sp.]|uniref:4,5-DOPA-extradiol-dioxygenase n=1 Tax=Desulfosediminicola sp. TaxID=2886825 RepID=UPI003AF296C3
MKLNDLNNIAEPLESTTTMPVLFLGHGSPMHAIKDDEIVQGFRTVSALIERPNAILCISAHWETRGTMVTAMEAPVTIHDFYGFPKELYEIHYPAPGSPDLAKHTRELITKTEVHLDDKWGLDHGAWTVLRHMYPKADIPVIQLSLDSTQGPKYHYELAGELRALRQKGILIVGSGNLVHNLELIAWDKLDQNYAYEWAEEASTRMKKYILDGNHQKLIDYSKLGKAFRLAIPTPEHYLPLLYALALMDGKDEITLFNDQPVGGSLSMTSVKIG